MFVLSNGEDTLRLMESASILAEFVLGELSVRDDTEDYHKRAIMIIQMALHLLQVSYTGPEPLDKIMLETTYMLESFVKPQRDA